MTHPTPVKPETSGVDMTKEHKIKLSEDFFEDVLSGRKPFEVRENDRGYQAGDTVIMEEIPRRGGYIAFPRKLKATITYVLNGWGLENGFVVFGIAGVEKQS